MLTSHDNPALSLELASTAKDNISPATQRSLPAAKEEQDWTAQGYLTLLPDEQSRSDINQGPLPRHVAWTVDTLTTALRQRND